METRASKKRKCDISMNYSYEILDIPNERLIEIMQFLTNNDLFAFGLACKRTLELMKWGIRSSRLQKRIIVNKGKIIKELLRWTETKDTVNELIYYTNTASREEVQEVRKYRDHDHVDRVDIFPEKVPGVTIEIALMSADDWLSNKHSRQWINIFNATERLSLKRKREKLFYDIVQHCTEIEKIKIQNNSYDGRNLFDFDCLKSFVSHQLRTTSNTKRAIYELFNVNSSLRELILISRRKDTYGKMIVTIDIENFNNLSANVQLKDLSEDVGEGITEVEFERFVQNFKFISKLSIDGVHENLTDQCMRAIAYNLNIGLEELEVLDMCNITNKGVNFISKFCKNIKSFKLHQNPYVTDTSIISLLSQAKLKKLELTDLYEIEEEGFYEIVQLSGNIEELNLSGNEYEVTEDVMEGISKYCKSLTSLNLSGIASFDGIDLRNVLSKIGSHLKSLDISDCENIFDEDVKSIPQSCTSLEYLHITTCSVECMNLLHQKIQNVKIEHGPWRVVPDMDSESEEEEMSFLSYE